MKYINALCKQHAGV